MRIITSTYLALVPPEEELTWARLMLLLERYEVVASGVVNATRWLGPDPLAIEIARRQGDESDYVRTLRPFVTGDRDWTADVMRRVQTWQRPSAIVRALIVCGNDWLYDHGQFRHVRDHYHEVLAISERYGSILGQAESHIRLAIVQTALGELTAAEDAAARGRDLVSRLGPEHRLHATAAWITALDADYLGGDWTAIANYWSRTVADLRLALRTNWLHDAALAAYAQVRAGDETRARQLLDVLTPLIANLDPPLWMTNGTVAFAGNAVWLLGAAELAPVYRAAARRQIDTHRGDFPCGSHELTVARMASLLGNHAEAETFFARVRLALEASGQRPLRAIVDLDEATALAKTGRGDPLRREHLLRAALDVFQALKMAPWIQRAGDALHETVRLERRRTGPRPGGLSDRELEVVQLVARGHSDRQIGDELYVSPRTVNAHIRNILAKTDCGNRTELSVWAMEHGALPDAAEEKPLLPPPLGDPGGREASSADVKLPTAPAGAQRGARRSSRR